MSAPASTPAAAPVETPAAARPLPPYTAARLGAAQAAQAEALRGRLAAAGVALPAWIDARPGRLALVIGDLAADPPLGRSAATLAIEHGPYVLRGLGALQLAAAAPRALLYAPPGPALESLRRAAAGTAVELLAAPPAWPSQPELDVEGALGRALVASPELLDRAAAALLSEAPRRLCTVAGAVARPLVLTPPPGATPRQLVAAAGGAAQPDWVALVSGAGAAPGQSWESDRPIPEGASLLLVLPAAHPLARRQRRPLGERLGRARAACLGCRLCSDVCAAPAAGSALRPHRVVPLLAGADDPAGRGAAPERALGAALDCSGCGACDVICPQGLGPGDLVFTLARRLREGGLSAEERLPPEGPQAPVVRLPRERLLRQLGLAGYESA